jgi:nucleoid DNA-binding protein
MKTTAKVIVVIFLVWFAMWPLEAGAMNKNQLVDAMAMDAAMTKADARKALDAFIKTVSNSMYKGQSVELTGFGTFSVVDGPSGKTVQFQPGEVLQQKVSLPADTTTTTAAHACVYTLSGISQAFSPSSGNGSFSVAADNACNWQAVKNVQWISIASGGSGKGNGTVRFSVRPNTAYDERMGNITVGDKTFTVKQYGKGGAGASGKPRPR